MTDKQRREWERYNLELCWERFFQRHTNGTKLDIFSFLQGE